MPVNKSIRVELRPEILAALDHLSRELGLRSRSALIERLLEEILLSSKEHSLDLSVLDEVAPET